ncbi:MAG TPA: HD domain-containing phosphohydrolase [Candidatus Aquilonibacter sp.]|nr:HD domain-containing phosphohydrolase [Candidatus Aquilonibacter sp.]
MSLERPRILCIDDEKNVLEGLTRTLRSLYDVETAIGGMQGIEALKTKGPFVIVMSDLRMPQMNGVQFLRQARQIAPDSVRVLLTGQGDMEAAIGAVNDGNIFRFLTKPCPTEILVGALAASAEQYRLVTSERVLLEQTLRGSIEALTEILALANPTAFGRATRVKQMIVKMMDHFEVSERWPVEVATMLSQVGYVTLPAKTQEKVYKGESLGEEEQRMLERIPHVLEQLLARIPRLDAVREILRFHMRPYNSDGKSRDHISGISIPWGARALKLALDFDVLESEHESHPFDTLRSRNGCYDPILLEAFAKLQGGGKQEILIHELKLRQIEVGMVFGEDVRSSKGLLLIARGQQVTPGLKERVRNFSAELGIREPIRMIVKPGKLEAEPETAEVAKG